MSSSADPSKASLSGQCQHTFSHLILPSERTSEQLHTRHVEAAAVKELDNCRFGAQILAERVDEYSLPFHEITHVNTELVDAGDERDQDWAGNQAVKVPRVSPDGWVYLLGQLASALLVHSRGLKRQEVYARMREDMSVFQSSVEVDHITQARSMRSCQIVRAMMAEDDAEVAGGGGQEGADSASC